MQDFFRDMLLFQFDDWLRYAGMLNEFCLISSYALIPFVIGYGFISLQPQPIEDFRAFVVAVIIILAVPSVYQPIAGFGIKIIESTFEDQNKGIIASWKKVKERTIKQAKKEKKKVTTFDVVYNMFWTGNFDYIEKALIALIIMCLMIVKLSYSVVYYITYTTSCILALLSIIPPFRSYTAGIIRSITFLIISAILIGFVLVFVNQALDFSVNDDGYIHGLVQLIQFGVLVFVLLGILKISHDISYGRGAEGWASQTASMLSYSMMSTAFKIPQEVIGDSKNSLMDNFVRPFYPTGERGKKILDSVFNGTKSFFKDNSSGLGKDVDQSSSNSHQTEIGQDQVNENQQRGGIREDHSSFTGSSSDRAMTDANNINYSESPINNNNNNNYENSQDASFNNNEISSARENNNYSSIGNKGSMSEEHNRSDSFNHSNLLENNSIDNTNQSFDNKSISSDSEKDIENIVKGNEISKRLGGSDDK